MNSQQVKTLDNLFRKAIHLRDKYHFCPLCGKGFNIVRSEQVNHWQGRRYLNTRWDMNNAILACEVCNYSDVSIEPVLLSKGIDTEALRRKAKAFGKPDFDEIKEHLEAFIREHQ